MYTPIMPYLRDRRNAFYFAFKGLYHSVLKEPHMRLHLLAAVLAVAAGFFVQVGKMEWLALLSAVCLVMITELFNTAIEKICDRITPEREQVIGYIKDISSAAVLLSALYALAVAAAVFGARLL